MPNNLTLLRTGIIGTAAAALCCFTPVLGRCRKLLDNLVRDHAELLHAGFDRYRRLFVEDAA